jgi:hypothetical protein
MKKNSKEKHEWSTRSHFVPDPEIPRGTPEGSGDRFVWKKLEKGKDPFDLQQAKREIKLKYDLKTLDDNLKKGISRVND